MRLDKYILSKYPDLTRAYIKQQIKLGNIRIGDKKIKPGYILREGDLVGFATGFEFPTETKIQPNTGIKLNIIYEDGNVIVIDKPAGLSVHPRQTKSGAPIEKEVNDTLVSGLLAYYPPLASVGDQPQIRPGIVHRLDKDTSGIMIVAKNQTSFERMKQQFKERKVQKKYIALISGCPEKDRGIIETYLTRSETDPSKQKVVSSVLRLPSDEGRTGWRVEPEISSSPQSPPHLRRGRKLREAVTEYKVTQKFKDYCLIEAIPKTGRLHQIRVQFAWLGHPIAGDTKYGRQDMPAPPGLKRQFLHAAELKITLPDGEEKTFSSPLPTELAQIIKGLKKN